ncbi:MAG: hypothetical protein GY863_19140 [bacterium]|nr:hypothetical protein [bacterium]
MKGPKMLLSELSGVKQVSEILASNRDRIIQLEDKYEKDGAAGLQNLGIRMVLACDTVFAILKDSSFRPPPCSTVFMVEEAGENEDLPEHLLETGNRRYHIIGEEIIAGKFPTGEEYIFVSDDFILYPGRRKGRTGNPAHFLIPPIAFQELETVKDELNITNIISVSPSTVADVYIRELSAFSPNEDLATILIGFDRGE